MIYNIREMHADFAAVRDGVDKLVGRLGKIGAWSASSWPKEMQSWPGITDADDLYAALEAEGLAEDDLNLRPIVEEVIEECDEFNALSGYEGVIRLLWRKKCPERLGRVVAGTAQLFPKKERDLWNNPNRPAPWWDVTISIPAWLCMDKMERIRLVHHELSHIRIDVDKKGHPKPALMGHDVEENLNTLARFGVFGKQQANFVAIGQRHPSWTGAVREYDIDVNGQASLFPKAWGQKGS